MTYNFRAWLNTKPDDEPYNFMDCTGHCAMGQYMTHLGEKWDIDRYNDHVNTEITEIGALAESKTFGELKKRVFEPV